MGHKAEAAHFAVRTFGSGAAGSGLVSPKTIAIGAASAPKEMRQPCLIHLACHLFGGAIGAGGSPKEMAGR